MPRCLCQPCSSSSDQSTLYMRSWCGCFREWMRAMWYQDRRLLPNPFLIFRFDLSTTSMKGLCGNAGCCHCLKVIGNAIGGPKNPSDKEPSAKKPTAKRPKRKKEQRSKSKKRKTKKQKRKKPKLHSRVIDCICSIYTIDICCVSFKTKQVHKKAIEGGFRATKN